MYLHTGTGGFGPGDVSVCEGLSDWKEYGLDTFQSVGMIEKERTNQDLQEGLKMKSYFACSLCHNGLLGGGLIVDENTITYKTGKVTVDKKYRNLELNRSDIADLSWKSSVFPIVTFEMKYMK